MPCCGICGTAEERETPRMDDTCDKKNTDVMKVMTLQMIQDKRRNEELRLKIERKKERKRLRKEKRRKRRQRKKIEREAKEEDSYDNDEDLPTKRSTNSNVDETSASKTDDLSKSDEKGMR
ncbi:unnamed protein product [Dimorphilus gyrociliatus]|uniref:Uncharacterized protein n=1 Tax=Dimorphilus gyrociliatus TaxID=2664684 RepID=A0A7I8W3J3_9ANNE|nr:unnamed protein product [Dimorphilus gyrociliatus]